MRLFYKDNLFDRQLLRTVSYSYYGGAEIGECLATASRIGERDIDGWHREWFATAERVWEQAEACYKRARFTSAREAFLKAANYYRTSAVFLLRKPLDERYVKISEKERQAFMRAADLFREPFEFINIPYERMYLPACFCKADGRKRPLLILTSGYDSSLEELYFLSVQAALNRGYHCLCFDGPGQGEVLVKQHIPFRPDWENVVKPVVDYALTRNEVDITRIALMGASFGGYLAARAVSGEHRIAACIADPGQYDLFEAMQSRLPGFLKGFPDNQGSFRRGLANLIFARMLRHPTKGWALRRALLVHDVSAVEDYFRLAGDFTLNGYVQHIGCPVLVVDAESDDIAAFAETLFDKLPGQKDYLKFLDKDGAGDHCEAGNRALFHQKIFDWLDKALNIGNG